MLSLTLKIMFSSSSRLLAGVGSSRLLWSTSFIILFHCYQGYNRIPIQYSLCNPIIMNSHRWVISTCWTRLLVLKWLNGSKTRAYSNFRPFYWTKGNFTNILNWLFNKNYNRFTPPKFYKFMGRYYIFIYIKFKMKTFSHLFFHSQRKLACRLVGRYSFIDGIWQPTHLRLLFNLIVFLQCFTSNFDPWVSLRASSETI